MSVSLSSDDFLIELVDKYKLFIVPHHNTNYYVDFAHNISNIDGITSFTNDGIPIDHDNIKIIKVKYNIIERVSINHHDVVEEYLHLLYDYFRSTIKISRDNDFGNIPPFLDISDMAYYNLMDSDSFITVPYMTTTLCRFIEVLFKAIQYYHSNLFMIDNIVVDLNEINKKTNANSSSSVSSYINQAKRKKHIRKI